MADPQEVKQEQIVRLAPFQEDYLADIFASAKGLTGEGSQMPYSAQQLADLSPAQQQAISSAMQGVGSFNLICNKVLKHGQGWALVQDLEHRSAIGQAGQATMTPTSYQEFMDPYTEDVIATTKQI